MTITDILARTDNGKIVNDLNQLYLSLQCRENFDDFFEMEDNEFLIRKLDEIDDKQVLYRLWSVFCYVPSNIDLIQYCNKCINQFQVENKKYSDPWILFYLIKNDSERGEELISKFVSSSDVEMRFVAIEALANSEIEKALHMMIDMYEFLGYEHDIIESIELWLCNEGTEDTMLYLEEKMKNSGNDKWSCVKI